MSIVGNRRANPVVTIVSFAAIVLASIGIFIAFVTWNMERQLKEQRKQLMDACVQPGALDELVLWADRIFAQSPLPTNAVRTLPRRFQKVALLESIDPFKDTDHHFIAIHVTYGGADNH